MRDQCEKCHPSRSQRECGDDDDDARRDQMKVRASYPVSQCGCEKENAVQEWEMAWRKMEKESRIWIDVKAKRLSRDGGDECLVLVTREPVMVMMHEIQ